MNRTDQAVKAGRFSHTLITLFLFVVVMSFYAYFRMTTNPVAFKILLLVLALFELIQLMILYRTLSIFDAGFESAFFVVFLSVFLGVYENSLVQHPTLLWTTIFYRPIYMNHGNRRVAFVLSLLIIGVVVPVTTGVVTDSSAVSVMMLVYALLVLCLWVFCSKLGMMVIDSVRD